MTFYNHIESVRGIAIDLTNGRKWRGASDKAAVFDALDAARREYMRLSDDNAKLREQIDAAHMSRLLTENENESLRELVAKYSAAAKYLCGFSHCNECNLDCASVFGDVPSGWDCARMLLDKKARELGVEVEE